MALISRLVVTVLACLIMTACGGGGGGSSSGQSTANTFAGAVLATANNVDRITVAWLPASITGLASNSITYKVHASTNQGFTPSSSTLVSTVTGATKTIVTGLQPNTTYYFKVIALDGGGQALSGTATEVTSKTFINPVVVNSSTPVQSVDDLSLGIATIAGNNLTFTSSPTTVLPTVGSYLAGIDSNGNAYLIQVASVSSNGGQIVVSGSAGVLGDAVTQGAISNSLTLFTPQTNASPNLMRSLRSMLFGTQSTSTTALDVGNGLLMYEEVQSTNIPQGVQVNKTGNSTYSISTQQRSSSLATSTNGGPTPSIMVASGSASDNLTVDLDIAFAPEVVSALDWSVGLGGVQLNNAILKLAGTMSVTANARYQFSAAGTFSRDISFDIFTRRYRQLYYIGPVPVYQDIQLTVNAVLNAGANSSVDTSATATLSDTVALGVQYDSATQGWLTQGPTNTTSKSYSMALNAKGDVLGSITLVPKVTVRFYSVMAGTITPEPILTADMAVQSIANANQLIGFTGISTQITALNSDFQFKCLVGADMTWLGRTIPLYSERDLCTSLPVEHLFSMPSLSLAKQYINSNKTFYLTASVTDGVNNAFQDGSIRWTVYPANSGTFTPATGSRQSMFVFNPGYSTAKIFFSGYGTLGELGRQFVQIDVSIPPNITVQPALTNLTSHGTGTFTVTLDGDGIGYFITRDQWAAAPSINTLLSVGTGFNFSANVAVNRSINVMPGVNGRLYFIATGVNGETQDSMTMVPFRSPPATISDGGLTWFKAGYDSLTTSIWSANINTVQSGYDLALLYCAANLDGLTGWRLPTRSELIALQASNKWLAAGWYTLGSNAGDYGSPSYWTSDIAVPGTGVLQKYFYVDITSGNTGSAFVSNSASTACVR